MFNGRVDRSGGREGKKSLRKTKINLNDKIKHGEKEKKEEPTRKEPSPSLEAPNKGLIDAACGLVNRRFENDTDKVINRAKNSNVDTMIIMSNDFDKQEALQNLAKQWNGSIYFMPGIHPDNVKRTNDKQMSQKITDLKILAASPWSVALFCGLDLTREIGTHFAQEKLFTEQIDLAKLLNLPIVLYQLGATDQIIEKVGEYADSLSKVAVYNFMGPESALQGYLDTEVDTYFMINATIAEPSEKGEALRQLLPKIPLEKILIATDSPFCTPQNITDVWIREARNEPSNMSYIVEAMATALNMAVPALSATLRKNAKDFFGLYDKEDVRTDLPAVTMTTSTEEPEKSEEKEEEPKIEHKEEPEIKKEEQEEVQVETPKDKVEEEIKFACHKCRKLLFTSKQVLSHSISSVSDEFAAKTARNKGKSKVEVGVCQMLFVKEEETDFNAILRGAMDDDDEQILSEETLATLPEGKLSCAGCKTKLGRWNQVSSLLCSCGAAVPPPCFMLRKKALDVIVPLKDAARVNEELLLERETGNSDEEEDDKKGKKKKKGGPKKTNKANFSSFRNKSYA